MRGYFCSFLNIKNAQVFHKICLDLKLKIILINYFFFALYSIHYINVTIFDCLFNSIIGLNNLIHDFSFEKIYLQINKHHLM